MTHACADLHVHSKYSDRPSEWFLRRIGSPESFVEPEAVYAEAKAAGMTFVTISDHNCIRGALELAHHPDTFISNEVTTYFPEDGCKLHVLVTGITESQFERIDELRTNVYEFRDYCASENIIVTCAHPFFRVNDRLDYEHVEKMMLLFNRFEGINGTRDQRACMMSSAIFGSLEQHDIERLADKYGIAPLGATPWKKTFTGGSDDHAGRYVAGAYTQTPPAETVAAFLDHIRNGDHAPAGKHGTSQLLAHSFVHIAYSYYSEKFVKTQGRGNTLLQEFFHRLLGRPKQPRSYGARLLEPFTRIPKFLFGPRGGGMTEAERNLVADIQQFFQAAPADGQMRSDRDVFELAAGISQQLAYRFIDRFAGQMREGRVLESLQSFSSLGPVGLSILPYIAAFKTQHKDEAFLKRMGKAFPAARSMRRGQRKAWITDTFDEINGVTRTIRTVGALAGARGRPLTIVTSGARNIPGGMDVVNFDPVGTFQLPEYEEQQMPFPPFLEILHFLENGGFSEIVISTPGPMGILGLAAAKLFGLPTTGIYHTDFPDYVRERTGDDNLELLAWRYMQWFYGQCDLIHAPSEATRQRLIRHGLAGDNIRVVGRGVDTGHFTPDKRRTEFWPEQARDKQLRLLYVGRVSQEKNLEVMFDGFVELARERSDITLLVVGDGPKLDEYRRRYKRPDIFFLGRLEGESLATAYASADAFVFPSKTDTFGNAILEAHASGLPAIVSSVGGPAELVRRFASGLIVEQDSPSGYAFAMRSLAEQPERLQALQQQSRSAAQTCSWDRILDEIWVGSEAMPERVES